MSIVIGTNTAATLAANNLAFANANLDDSLEELSTGSRLINSSVDPGASAVALKLTAAGSRDGDLQDNVSDVTSLLQTQSGALSVAGTVLDRISQLETLYQDPTKSSSDLASYDNEFTQLQSELSSLTSETFNGASLFGSTGFKVDVTNDLSSSSAVSISGADLASSSAGIGAITSTSVSSLGSLSLGDITQAIQNVGNLQAANGGEQSRLGFASSLLTDDETHLDSAVSTISDVNVAEATTAQAKWQVLVQSAVAMLAQANLSGQMTLKLITG